MRGTGLVAAVPACAARRTGAATDHTSVVAIAAVTIKCFIKVSLTSAPSWGPNIPYTCPSAVVSSLNIPLFWEASLASKALDGDLDSRLDDAGL